MKNSFCIFLLILLSFGQAKAYDITYETKTFDEIKFTPSLDFRGVYEVETSKDGSNFTYPFTLEGGGEVQFGESKNKLKITTNFTRNVDEFDKKFFGKFSDVYYERTLNKNHKILIGNSRIPIGMEGSTGLYSLLFAKRAQIAKNFGDARAPGVRFRGKFDRINYDLGGYSSTRYLQDFDDGIEFAGWIDFKPFYDKKGHVFEDFKIGTGVNTGRRDENYTVAGFGGEWKYEKFLINAEYAYADGSNSSKYNSNKQQGFYTTFAYNITDKLQAAVRYDVFDTNTKKSDDILQKYTVGLNYYVIDQKLRFGLNYTYTNNSLLRENQNSVYFMTQIML